MIGGEILGLTVIKKDEGIVDLLGLHDGLAVAEGKFDGMLLYVSVGSIDGRIKGKLVSASVGAVVGREDGEKTNEIGMPIGITVGIGDGTRPLTDVGNLVGGKCRAVGRCVVTLNFNFIGMSVIIVESTL